MRAACTLPWKTRHPTEQRDNSLWNLLYCTMTDVIGCSSVQTACRSADAMPTKSAHLPAGPFYVLHGLHAESRKDISYAR